MNLESGKIKFSVSAPAKINTHLRITGRRPNGYHDLDMVMVTLGLADEIDVEITPGEITIESNSSAVPNDASNSMWKAITLLRQESGRDFGAKIRIQKNIPVAAGLGGGTSDAASILKSVNEKLQLHISQERLNQLAVKIGADVPFFLANGPQKVTGIGDILEPTSLPPLWVILINPGFPVSTKDVYGWWDDTISPEPPLKLRGGEVLTTLKVGVTPVQLENDLERVVIPRYPVLATLKEVLIKAGALGALMSGSGGTVFGLYDSKASRDQGFEVLMRSKNPEWWIFKTNSERA